MEKPDPNPPASPVPSSTTSVAEAWHQFLLAVRRQLASWLHYLTQQLQQLTDQVAPPASSSNPETILPLDSALQVWVASCWQWGQQHLFAWIPDRWLRDRTRLSMVAGGMVLIIGIVLLVTSQPLDNNSPGVNTSTPNSSKLAPSPVPTASPEILSTPELTPSPKLTDPSPALPSPPNSSSLPTSPSPSSSPLSSPLPSSPTTLASPSLLDVILSDSEEPWVALVAAPSLEQQLQDQLTASIRPYSSALVQGIMPDYPRSRLTVRISHEWYNLEPTQQDDVATNLYRQVMALNINNLDLVDDLGCTVARSPVVGADMVVLKRRP